jgi:hypothetical protein
MSDYSETEIGLQILEMLDHHLGTYRYRGEAGQEYSVIQSIFAHLNNQSKLNNAHIRWYSVMVFLKRSFHDYYMAGNRPMTLAITELGSLIENIARLGIWISSKIEIRRVWTHKMITRINRLLVQLIHLPQWEIRPAEDHEVFRLTTLRAAENTLRLAELSGTGTETLMNQTLNSARFQTHIRIPLDRMPVEQKQYLTNMDDFWNGFIP